MSEAHKPAIVVEGLEKQDLAFPDVKLFRSAARSDIRGSVQPVFNRDYFREIGIDTEWVHENHCVSPLKGTMRGFHYQLPPYAQPKLIRVVKGKILDVSVDLRRSSPTFGQHVKAIVDAENWHSILVPGYYGHCYLTLEPDCVVIFKLGMGFAPDFARGFAWNDPDIAVDWGVDPQDVVVLARDVDRPRFSDLDSYFP